VLRHFAARDEIRVERREQYRVGDRVVPPDAVVLGGLARCLSVRGASRRARFIKKLYW
jgi:hypothetical protein